MSKKEYHISGFDCANCAAKAEAHLNKDKEVSYCRLDFAMNKLYISYIGETWSINKLKSKIAEVEDDPLDIHESEKGFEGNSKIFTGQMYFLLARIIVGILVAIFTNIFLNNPDSYWINFGIYLGTLVLLMYDISFKVINHIIHRENILDHYLLIVISIVGAFTLVCLQHSSGDLEDGIFVPQFEALMVVLLFQIGRIIESIATNKSKSAVMAAVSLRIDYANLIDGDEVKKVTPKTLSIGDHIVVPIGELIPIDGRVIEGEGLLDISSLTGEYIPKKVQKDSIVNSGCIVKDGNLVVEVTKTFEHSTVSKIVDLISHSGENKSKADEFIAKFAKVYTPIIVALSILIFGIMTLATGDWQKSLYQGLEILVTGCPCAIVISVPLAYFAAIGLASKNGIVVKGAKYLEEITNLGTLITDKTGTITHGAFEIIKKYSTTNEEELLHYLRAAESLSSHPAAKAICHDVDVKKLASEQKNFKEIPGKGVISTYKGKQIIAGNALLLKGNDIEFEEVNDFGLIVYCAVNDKYMGYVILSDVVKEDAQPMVDLLHGEKVEIVLLTGDKEENAKHICENLGIDRWHSGLLPDEKTKYLELEMGKTKKSVAFIGDGINDAPSIIRSDIGFAMGGIGSDIAVENADVVIMNDDPAKVYDVMHIAKIARSTAIFNIVFALLVKAIVAILVSVPTIEISMIVPVLADTGLTVLLVINSLLLLFRKVKRKKVV